MPQSASTPQQSLNFRKETFWSRSNHRSLQDDVTGYPAPYRENLVGSIM